MPAPGSASAIADAESFWIYLEAEEDREQLQGLVCQCLGGLPSPSIFPCLPCSLGTSCWNFWSVGPAGNTPAIPVRSQLPEQWGPSPGCPPLQLQGVWQPPQPGQGRQHSPAGSCQQPHLGSPQDTPAQPWAARGGCLQPCALSPGRNNGSFRCIRSGKSPGPTRAPLQDAVAHSSSGLGGAGDGVPHSMHPAGREQPQAAGESPQEGSGAAGSPALCPQQPQASLPWLTLQPCARAGARGLLAVFVEGSVFLHDGSWDIYLLLEPGQTALGKASSLPWESPARRNSCSPTVPQGPGAPLCPQCCGDVTQGLCPACCLIPVSPWLSPPLSTGSLP
ncbi:uncharacterized protein LOC107214478 [Parus major]|uniref:uncharacterized protein LOC107214478 n=1 Tax=Parus major TaxID=9157 RepID=UPI00144456E1|nr:uncharacterized protein LOC107214478 [Parus major]